MQKGQIIWRSFLAVCLCIATIVLVYAIENGIHKPVPREIIINHEELMDNEQAIPAETVFTGMTDPVTDSDGKMSIPDNTVVSEITCSDIRTDFCDFKIPEVWVDNVVIKVIKADQKTDKELYDNPVENTEIVQFFEKNTFLKYQKQENVYAGNAAKMGKLTELYVTDLTKNEENKKAKEPQELYVADITVDKTPTFSAYMYQPKDEEEFIDKEFEKEYEYLTSIDYQGRIISSLTSRKGDISIANNYIKSQHVTGFDANGEGMTEGAVIPENFEITKRNVQEKATHAEQLPDELTKEKKKNAYQWTAFSIPWSYLDKGEYYPYSAMESGGIRVQNPEVPATDIDMDTTPAPTPTATPTPGISYEEPTTDTDTESYDDTDDESDTYDEEYESDDVIDITGG